MKQILQRKELPLSPTSPPAHLRPLAVYCHPGRNNAGGGHGGNRGKVWKPSRPRFACTEKKRVEKNEINNTDRHTFSLILPLSRFSDDTPVIIRRPCTQIIFLQ